VNECATADNRIEQRAAQPAVSVVAIFVTKDHEGLPAFGEIQLVAFYARERLESRSSGTPAVRAVAIRSVDECIRHDVLHGAAITLSGKRALARFSWICHATFLRG
jgi:hypothetical protein